MITSIRELKTRGYVVVPYPTDLRIAVQKTMDLWKKFCTLPLEVKKGLPYTTDLVGYDFRDGTGNKGDYKENLDVSLAGHLWLKTHAENIKSVEARQFIEESTALVHILKPIILDFAKQSEEVFSLNGFTNEVDQGEDAFFVRFIHYFGNREVGEEIANAHTDKSGFSLHLFESTPGLQCLTFNEKWIDMPVSEGETVIFAAMQMQLRSNNELKALCHRAIANTESAEKGRYAAICYVQLKKTPKYDKGAQGRLQEKKSGFNYTLPYEEFRTLFK